MPSINANTLTLESLSVTDPKKSRPVITVTTAPEGLEGEGFPVKRAFAGIPKHLLDPFIHMDQMGEIEYAAGEPKGTPWHPHRGFETFTYLINGEFLHQDSNGGGGYIREGGTQYMTAGDGILHIETPPENLVKSGGLFHGVQLWINLPREKKRIAPQYQDLNGKDVSLLSSRDGGALLRILAGTIDGHKGPGISHTPLAIGHLTIAPSAQVRIPWSENFNALVYILAGTGTAGPAKRPVKSGQLAVMGEGSSIELSADSHQEGPQESMEVFITGGVPLQEPVFQYGPFVMNTKNEVLEAFEDYQKGRLGVIPPNAIQPYKISN